MNLFPELPEDLASLSDEELADLLKEHEVAAELIENEDEEFIAGMSAEEVLEALETGVEQIEKIVAEQASRVEQQNEYQARKEALAARRREQMATEEAAAEPEETDEVEDEEEPEALAVEDEPEETEEDEVEETEETGVLVASSEVQNKAERRPVLRRPPAPSANRLPADQQKAVLTAASGLDGIRGGQPLDRLSLAEAMKTVARRVGPPAKSEGGIEQRFFIGQAVYPYPDERRLMPGELDVNTQKIQAVIPDVIPGMRGNKVLTASGGLCAPLTPFYSMPNFAVTSRPVRDALPSFQAERGGVSVPEATVIGDITSAISNISADDDALGGTFATKSCQDLECPDYTDVAVQILAHCREYGNLNARAWPEKIAHENDLTMAALARTAETFLLDRIKAQSINVTSSTPLNAFVDLVDAIVRAQAAIRYRLRMSPGGSFRVLLPEWVKDLLVDDQIRTQDALERFAGHDRVAALLSRYRINPAYYLDDVTGGVSQGFASEAAGTLDALPTEVQFAIYPEGAFLHLDGGTLDLGIVRDSTLNSTNDFQIFGEQFENVVRIGPAQSALWVSVTTAPTGAFPALV